MILVWTAEIPCFQVIQAFSQIFGEFFRFQETQIQKKRSLSNHFRLKMGPPVYTMNMIPETNFVTLGQKKELPCLGFCT